MILMLVAIHLLVHDLLYYFNKKEFESKSWISGDQKQRGYMVHHLIDSKILEGKTKDEVISILGKPDVTSVQEKFSMEEIIYNVDIGFKFGGTTWPYYLRLYFKPDTGEWDGYCLAD